MTETIFDHDRLDMYRLAVEYTAESFRSSEALSGLQRHARDHRIVSMLTRMAMKADGVQETPAAYGVESDYEHERRCAEHRCAEHEHETEREPEDRGAADGRNRLRLESPSAAGRG